MVTVSEEKEKTKPLSFYVEEAKTLLAEGANLTNVIRHYEKTISEKKMVKFIVKIQEEIK
jgi:hypothetical protein